MNVAADEDTWLWSNPVEIKITAKADSIKGKNTTLQVGQAVPLEALLTYKAGKKTLAADSVFDREVEITADLKSSIEDGGYFKLYEDTGYVMALKPKGKVTLNLTDKYVGSSAKVTLKSTVLAPVKNLQVKDAIDNRFTIRFERSKYAEAYRIEVKNGRNTVMRSVYAENNNYANDEDYYLNYSYRTDYGDDRDQGSWWISTDEKGKEYCEYTIRDLTQQSKYSVTVTALFKDEKSKAVTKKANTTKLPASEISNLDERYLRGDVVNRGGIDIRVASGTNEYGNYYASIKYDDYIFVSGNDYTLKAIPTNPGAEYGITDTLTWSVTDRKVASIKANAGTYSAMFKALKQGTTIIEVRSGITKHVIARYEVTVRALGDAYSSFTKHYGDNEDLRAEGNNGFMVYIYF